MQRAVVLLNEKGIEYDITYIELKDKPDWFLDISPMGKVPVLRVGETTLFESMVICEYLDEISPPSLHPADALQKALHRAWSEFSSELFMDLHRMMLAEDRAGLEEHRQSARMKLERLERELGEGPFFTGSRFSLTDVAVAPLFLRLALLDDLQPPTLLDRLPKVQRWSDALLGRESVRTSVVSDFARLFADYLAASGSYLGNQFSGKAGGRG